jgi:hypothetical protein
MSSSALSYKSLIGQLNAFADGHFIIRKFTFGEETDYDLEKEGEYPAMHVLHPSVSVEKGAINYDLVIQFADLPRDIETKTTYQMEQISDLFRLGQDLLNTIANENGVMLFGEDAEIIGTPRMEAFAQETKNNLVVVSLSFTLQLPNDWSACDIPADWTIGQSGGDTPGVPVVYVISVTGLDTDNTDPQNPVVRIAVDGTTITGEGTPEDPLVAVGGGAVDSVNGQTGVVVLDATDVGADPAGSAATAESNANDYTDTQIAALTFVEGVTGNIVDNTDPQNPIVDQLQSDWNQSDNTQPDFIKNKPTITTGTVEGVTGDSVDNTDPANPVVNAIPLSGTAVGAPVTGNIENDSSSTIEYFQDDGSVRTSVYFRSGEIKILFDDSINTTEIQIPSSDRILINSSDASFRGLVYSFDNEINLSPYSLIPFWTLKKRFWTKAGTPNANDDDLDGFIVGSLIWDTTNSILYRATSVSSGAAVWTAAISAGTVTSVGLSAPSEFTVSNSPVTGSGTLTFTKANQNANLVYAGPTTGAAAAPTFRSLVDADIPAGIARQDSAILTAGTVTTQTVASGATNYGFLNGVSVPLNTNATNNRSVVPIAGTLSRFYLYTTGSQSATGSLVSTIRSNGVDSSITITIAAGAAGGVFSDTTNTLAVSAGDMCDVKFVNNATAASITLRSWSSLLTR